MKATQKDQNEELIKRDFICALACILCVASPLFFGIGILLGSKGHLQFRWREKH